jgi:hypothetical protein
MDTTPTRNTVISVRVDDNSLHAIDLLVKAGLAQSRSEAAAQFVAIGIRSADDLLVQARELGIRLQRLKSDLVVAIKARDVAGARAVLEQDPGLLGHWSREGETPVLLSIRSGANELTQLLIERGAELDVFEATAIGDMQRVRQFLDAEPGLVGARSHDGWTLLHMVPTSAMPKRPGSCWIAGRKWKPVRRTNWAIRRCTQRWPVAVMNWPMCWCAKVRM